MIQLVLVSLILVAYWIEHQNAAIQCGELSTLENGRTIYSGDATAPYDLDTIATYMCNDGYVLERVVERRCTAGVGGSRTGVWTGRDPTCTRRSNSCGLLHGNCFEHQFIVQLFSVENCLLSRTEGPSILLMLQLLMTWVP